MTPPARPTFAPQAGGGGAGPGHAGAPVGEHGAAGAGIRTGSEEPVRTDLSGKLARLSETCSILSQELGEVAAILREVELASARERALMSSVNPAPKKLLTARDVAARISVDERTIRRWRREGKMPRGIEFGGAIVRWRSEEIEEWISR